MLGNLPFIRVLKYMSGIIIKGALTLHLLLVKSTALALSVGSGLAIGKEGPYIHLVCVGGVWI